jgi:putative hydrolase of the HAD superfamily
MPLDAFQLVAFDLDDTLYLERDYVYSGFASVARWLAVQRCWSDAAERRFLLNCWTDFASGPDRQRIFDRTLRQAGLEATRSLVTACVARYRAHRPRIALLPDARCLLQGLYQRPATTLCIITDGFLRGQAMKARALGLSNWVRRVVFTDRWGRAFWKPHPRAFEFVQRRCGLPASACVYIGDNPLKDFQTPQALGWHTIRIRRPAGIYAASAVTPNAPPDQELADLWPLCPARRRQADYRPDARIQER